MCSKPVIGSLCLLGFESPLAFVESWPFGQSTAATEVNLDRPEDDRKNRARLLALGNVSSLLCASRFCLARVAPKIRSGRANWSITQAAANSEANPYPVVDLLSTPFLINIDSLDDDSVTAT